MLLHLSNLPALASQLATAKYPIRAQASYLVFWWARLGGFMGVTSAGARVGEEQGSMTSDGSKFEFSWAVPYDTDTTEGSNRRIRFTIDPLHPERGHRIAGGGVLDYLWSPEGSMGIVKDEPGSKDWKDILEKWLFPDIKSTEEFVEGTTYMIAFDLEPSGEITLKQYYVPPHPAPPEPFKRLVKDLHPSLEAPFNMFVDFVHGDGKDSRMKWFLIACGVTRFEKNRLKVYVLSERTTLKDMIYDMTLGGRITGPRVDVAMANFSKFFSHLFPYVKNEESNIKVQNNDERAVPTDSETGGIWRTITNPLSVNPSHTPSKNDYETARSTESFFKDVGKPGEEGWMVKALGHAKLSQFTVSAVCRFIQTSQSPSSPGEEEWSSHNGIIRNEATGWEVTNYYSAEIFAPERDSN
ncbi:hypothetical protein C0995_011262 [Termitomyces sp. Mi166|nr:hypothetical protein C0995_011262 [Termitomyces sp. Mi166\